MNFQRQFWDDRLRRRRWMGITTKWFIYIFRILFFRVRYDSIYEIANDMVIPIEETHKRITLRPDRFHQVEVDIIHIDVGH